MKKKRTLERLSQEPFLELAPHQTRRAGGGFIPSCDTHTYSTQIGRVHDVESPIYC